MFSASINPYYPNTEAGRVIAKPWGFEKIIEHNSDYIVKEIQINQNEETSLQYHENKRETMVFQKGNGDIYFGSNPMSLEHIRYYPGFSMTFDPKVIHKVMASTLTVMLECSTNHPYYTIRISDKYGRKNI